MIITKDIISTIFLAFFLLFFFSFSLINTYNLIKFRLDDGHINVGHYKLLRKHLNGKVHEIFLNESQISVQYWQMDQTVFIFHLFIEWQSFRKIHINFPSFSQRWTELETISWIWVELNFFYFGLHSIWYGFNFQSNVRLWKTTDLCVLFDAFYRI